MTEIQWLNGRIAAIDGSGPAAEAIIRALKAAGAATTAFVPADTAALHVLVTILPPVAGGRLSLLPIAHYEHAFSVTMERLYRTLHVTVPRIKASGGGTVVTIFDGGIYPRNMLAQALADGVESLTACFGASFAAPPDVVRVNGIRLGTARSPEDFSALAETVLVLASDQSAYMNGTTVLLRGAIGAIAI